MNADRIVVVAGGEIVEQGSHDDLIRAKGKYAELWSKQIFVKPKAKDAKDPPPGAKRAKVPNLVNDLTAEATNTELAKVKSAPTTLSTTSHDDSESDKQDKADPGTAAAKTPLGHKKEV